MSSPTLFSLSPPSSSRSSISSIYEKYLDTTNEEISETSKIPEISEAYGKYYLSLLGLISMEHELTIASPSRISFEALCLREEKLCESQFDFDEIKKASGRFSLLHQYILSLGSPLGREEKAEESNIHEIIETYILKTAENFKISINKNLSNKLGNLKKDLINNFSQAIINKILKSEDFSTNQNIIVCCDSIQPIKTQIEQTIQAISVRLTNKSLAEDLEKFGRKITIFDRIIFTLLRRGIDINARTTDTEETALHLAVQQENCFLLILALLKYGANPNLYNQYKETPVHLAIQARNVLSILPALLNYGGKPNSLNAEKQAPIHLAFQTLHPLPILEILVRNKKINLNLPNRNGDTAVHLAFQTPHTLPILKILVQHKKINLNLPNRNGDTAVHLAFQTPHALPILEVLVQHKKINFNLANDNGDMAVHLAFQTPSALPILKILVQHEKINLDLPNENGDAALHLAFQAKNAFWILKLLLDHGAHPDMPNHHLKTVLHLAAQDKNSSIIKLLLEYGANANLQDKNGETALDIALRNEDNDSIFLLGYFQVNSIRTTLVDSSREVKELQQEVAMLPTSTLLRASAATQATCTIPAVREKNPPPKPARSVTETPRQTLKDNDSANQAHSQSLISRAFSKLASHFHKEMINIA